MQELKVLSVCVVCGMCVCIVCCMCLWRIVCVRAQEQGVHSQPLRLSGVSKICTPYFRVHDHGWWVYGLLNPINLNLPLLTLENKTFKEKKKKKYPTPLRTVLPNFRDTLAISNFFDRLQKRNKV